MAPVERLAFGTLTKTALLANDDYLVSSFPYSDRPNAPFVGYPEIVTPYVERYQTGAGNERYYGKLNWQWSLNLTDAALWEYLYVTEAAYDPTPIVTVLTKNLFYPGGDKYVAIVAFMRFPPMTPDGVKPVAGKFFDNPLLEFYGGEYAAP